MPDQRHKLYNFNYANYTKSPDGFLFTLYLKLSNFVHLFLTQDVLNASSISPVRFFLIHQNNIFIIC